jgi:hypothetical protein
MDADRFDAWTVALTMGAGPRRTALRLLAGVGLAVPLVRFGLKDAAAQCVRPGGSCNTAADCCVGLVCPFRTCCRPEGAKCRRGDQCCSRWCRKRRGRKTGKCACLAVGKPCSPAAPLRCCSGSCGANGRCGLCPPGQRDCNGTCRQCCADGDCTGGKVCRARSCVCTTAWTCNGICQECCVDRHCPAGLVCQAGRCCLSNGESCALDKDCCSGFCGPVSGSCE